MSGQVKKTPMKLGNHTYGYYYPSNNEFCCSHGAWCSFVEWIDEDKQVIRLKLLRKVFDYEVIDFIPEEYDYT